MELWDSNSHVTQEHEEREWQESKFGGSRLSVLSAFTLFTVYSYKVVLVHSAVVTLYSPANPSTIIAQSLTTENGDQINVIEVTIVLTFDRNSLSLDCSGISFFSSLVSEIETRERESPSPSSFLPLFFNNSFYSREGSEETRTTARSLPRVGRRRFLTLVRFDKNLVRV